MKAKNLRELSDDELTLQLKERGDALRHFHFQMATGSVDNTRGARKARRDVARIKTIMRERELAAKREAK
ncbi:MAG: 50S ribosomal protein L29 [Candidatus Hydrogenedentes bacterium]|nr:50S ribosomal protein L29 [Candidatus Hydrogenedentota bacterium]